GDDGRVPVALFSIQFWKVNRSQDLEAFVHGLVLLFNPRKALHVGLSKAEKNVEVRIRILRRGARGKCDYEKGREQKTCQLHFHNNLLQCQNRRDSVARGPLLWASCNARGMGCPGIRLATVRRYPRFRMIDCRRRTPDRRTRSRMHRGAKNRRRNHMYPSQSCCALIRAGRKATAVLPL